MIDPKCIYQKGIFAKFTRLACLLSFASLFAISVNALQCSNDSHCCIMIFWRRLNPSVPNCLGLLKLRVARKEDLFFLSITFRELRKETLNLRKEKLPQSSSDARSINPFFSTFRIKQICNKSSLKNICNSVSMSLAYVQYMSQLSLLSSWIFITPPPHW